MPPNKAAGNKGSAGDEAVIMTKGSRYKVVSRGSGPEPIQTVGIFKGYTAFGHDSALSIQLDPEKEGEQGLIRIIPCMTVLAIDVITFKPEEKLEEKEEVKVYFG